MKHEVGPIERGIPIPPARPEPAVRWADIGAQMAVGDSRLMSWADLKSLRSTMYRVIPGSKWSFRPEGDLYRIWRRA